MNWRGTQSLRFGSAVAGLLGSWKAQDWWSQARKLLGRTYILVLFSASSIGAKWVCVVHFVIYCLCVKVENLEMVLYQGVRTHLIPELGDGNSHRQNNSSGIDSCSTKLAHLSISALLVLRSPPIHVI